MGEKARSWVMKGVDGLDLSRVQRWLLANQYRLLERATSDEAQALSYRQAYEALERGYEAHYSAAMAHIELNTLSPAQCREVSNILDLYLALQASCAVLDDREDIEPSQLVFPGFEPKRESRLRGYAHFLRQSPESRYARLAVADDLSSRRPMLEEYRAMLETWTRMLRRRELTAAEVRQFLPHEQE